jgi:hypothetical protein
MIDIRICGREWIVKDGRGFSEVDTVLPKIGHRLPGIPRKDHKVSIATAISSRDTIVRACGPFEPLWHCSIGTRRGVRAA